MGHINPIRKGLLRAYCERDCIGHIHPILGSAILYTPCPVCVSVGCVRACARASELRQPRHCSRASWVEAHWPGLQAQTDLKADSKVDGWVKLGADFLCQVFLKRRLVLSLEDTPRIRHHPNNMVRAAAGSEPELLETRRGSGDNSIGTYATTGCMHPQWACARWMYTFANAPATMRAAQGWRIPSCLRALCHGRVRAARLPGGRARPRQRGARARSSCHRLLHHHAHPLSILIATVEPSICNSTCALCGTLESLVRAC